MIHYCELYMSVQICKNEYFYDLWGQISGGQSVMNVTMGIIEKKMVTKRTTTSHLNVKLLTSWVLRICKSLNLCITMTLLPNNFACQLLPNNSYKPITSMAWIHAQVCKLQKRVHLTRSRK
jgi:hypothetical protein